MPRMVLERQFAGPLQDTLIQRWRDPADGTICYIYLPITAPHSSPTQSGYVQYGPNSIGSISCAPTPSPPQKHNRKDRSPTDAYRAGAAPLAHHVDNAPPAPETSPQGAGPLPA